MVHEASPEIPGVHLSSTLDGPTAEALMALIGALASHSGVRLEIDVTGATFSDPRVVMLLNRLSRRRVRPSMALVTDETARTAGRPRTSGGPSGLTAREADVISKVSMGLSNAEICERTYLSINSVKSYIRSAYGKIGVTSRTQAVLWAVEHGLGPLQLEASQQTCCHAGPPCWTEAIALRSLDGSLTPGLKGCVHGRGHTGA